MLNPLCWICGITGLDMQKLGYMLTFSYWNLNMVISDAVVACFLKEFKLQKFGKLVLVAFFGTVFVRISWWAT